MKKIKKKIIKWIFWDDDENEEEEEKEKEKESESKDKKEDTLIIN